MMRRLLFLFAISLLSTSTFAQATQKLESWRTYSPSAHEFAVDVPMSVQNFGQADNSQRFSWEFNGAYLYVFSEPLVSSECFETVRQALETLGQSRDLISIDNSSPVSFLDRFGYWQTLKVFRTDARVYLAQSIALDENNEVATRFIKSFGRGEQPSIVPKLPVAPPKANDKERVTRKPAAPPNNSDTGSGSSSGSGGVAVGSFQPPSPNATSVLRILSKPRPGYTDLARIYGIQGKVVVEVVFLSNGEIGPITPVTQLPMGLTQTTINAAKRVVFQPAYENGTPVTVTKKLEY